MVHENCQIDLAGIDLARLLEGHGLETTTKGRDTWAQCPYHDDRHPSCRSYDDADKQRGHCFACGTTFDAIDLERHLTGCDFNQALGRLGLAPASELTPAERKRIERRKRQRQKDQDLERAFQQWLNEESDRLGLLIRCIRRVSGSWRTPKELDR